MIDVEQFDPLDPGLIQLLQIVGADLVARLDIDFAGGFSLIRS